MTQTNGETLDARASLATAGSSGAHDIIGASLPAEADAYRRQFERAEPFKHVVIEGFFTDAFARALFQDFPSFDPARAMNEFGAVGRKAVHEQIEAISVAYGRLDECLQSDRFLRLISKITGIPDLLADPNMYGGGTHENLHGQDLDPHVDFNYDPPTKLHRRINLLVYLNEEWREEWGGAIELHSDPRNPDLNRIVSFAPTFNRALIFETNEKSWHGFPRIELPEDKRHLSRKSLSVYLYTKDRPHEEIVPEHGTFYVQRPLPAHIRPGHTLSEADYAELRNLLDRRDSWIGHYQRTELKVSAQMGEFHERLGQLQWLQAELQKHRERALGGVIKTMLGSLRDRWAGMRSRGKP